MQPRYRGPARASGSPWVLLQTTDQGSSPSDPTGFAASASFDSTTGLFDVTTTAVATDIDGFREGWVRWATPWLTAFPGFDPETDIAEVLHVFSAWPVAGSKFGVANGLIDNDVANLATASGTAYGCFDSAATPTFTMGKMSSTGVSGVQTALAATLQAFGVQYQYRRHPTEVIGGIAGLLGIKVGNAWATTPQIDQTSIELASADPSTWWLHQGVYHDGTVAAGGTRLAWKTYTRVVRMGSRDP